MTNEQKSPEQQRYIRLCAQTKKMYRAESQLADAQIGMSQTNDAASMMRLGYQLHQTEQTIKKIAKDFYVEKMELEQRYPEFKVEAQAYCQKMKAQKQTIQNTQSF